MTDRWSRFAPLIGVLFVALTVVGIFGSGESPEGNASSAKVIAYYHLHESNVKTFDIVFIFAFLALVVFAAVLRSFLRRAPRAEGAAAVVLAGALLMAAAALIGTSIELGLAENITHLERSTAQALNLISDEIFLPALCGAFLFSVGSGVAILRGANLPKWLGWVAIVIGVLTLVPPTSMPALFALLIWSLLVSILMFLRTGADSAVDAAPLAAGGA
ncbi:MAG TPA: DUF4386 family protein [Solirubrobacteraceae bacterium]|nr:DUF4386 family protein [Solirubrobacteraceae bacterium]